MTAIIIPFPIRPRPILPSLAPDIYGEEGVPHVILRVHGSTATISPWGHEVDLEEWMIAPAEPDPKDPHEPRFYFCKLPWWQRREFRRQK